MISRYTYSADSVKRAVVDSNGNGKYYVGPFASFQRNDGAFNSIDPLAEKYYSISPYAYCAGNPVNLVDPLGLFNIKTGEIEQGDNLASITKKINDAYSVNLTMYDIAKVNKISNPDVIYTGNYIILPGQNIELHFDLHSLYVYDKSYSMKLPYLEWRGTSGRDRYQDSKYQSYKNIGPIPEGLWDVDYRNTQHFEDLSWWNQFKSYMGGGEWPGAKSSWGTHRTWIYPIGDTNTFGRSGFSIHGGKSPGSAGCIDLTIHNNSFHNWLENNKQIILRVKYD